MTIAFNSRTARWQVLLAGVAVFSASTREACEQFAAGIET